MLQGFDKKKKSTDYNHLTKSGKRCKNYIHHTEALLITFLIGKCFITIIVTL